MAAVRQVSKILQASRKASGDIAARRFTPDTGLACSYCQQELTNIEGAVVGDGPIRLQAMGCRNTHCGRIEWRLLEMPVDKE